MFEKKEKKTELNTYPNACFSYGKAKKSRVPCVLIFFSNQYHKRIEIFLLFS